MKKKMVCYGLIILMFIIAGCNISDYKYTEPSESAVNEICDEKTKICYTVDEKKEAESNENEDFDNEFEKLKQIVDDMSEDEEPKTENDAEEKDTELKEEDNDAEEEDTEIKEEDDDAELKVEDDDDAEEKEEVVVGTTKIDQYMKVFEGERVKLNVKSSDPDGDNLTYTFSKPLDENGEWETIEGDRGKYTLYVTVSDGNYKQTSRILLEVKKYNIDPVLEPIDDIEIYEGETVFINAKATDEDNDPLKITYSGWMNTNSKKTGYDDAGEYEVTVTVTDDDFDTDSQVVKITVKDKNRAPIIEQITLE